MGLKIKKLNILLLILTVLAVTMLLASCTIRQTPSNDTPPSSGNDGVSTKSPSEGLSYTLSDDGSFYIVTGLGDCQDTDVIIPSEYDEKPVKSIDSFAFSYDGADRITSVVIPDSVTSIGAGAFNDCQKLTAVTLPSGITCIEQLTFAGCNNLTNINLPDSITSIGIEAFEGCNKIKDITLGNNVTYIGIDAFLNTGYYNDTANWENGVLYIGKYLIKAEDSISGTYEIKSGTSYVAENAFSNCHALTGISIPESLKIVDDGAFEGCSKIADINVTDISKWCMIDFRGNYSNPHILSESAKMYLNGESLSGEIVIDDSVTNIPAYTFFNCPDITSITIPHSVTTISPNAFWCIGLKTVKYTGDINGWAQINFNGSLSTPLYLNGLYNNIEFYIDNEKVTSAEITTATKISEYAFYACKDLEKVTINDDLTSIGQYAFDGCTNLTSITIGSSVASIGSSAFDKCNSLSNVKYTGNINDWAQINFGSMSSNPICYAKNLYIPTQNGTQKLTSVVITTAEKISDYAFYNCKGLTSVTMQNNITSIGDCAFSGCENITELTLSQNIQSFGYEAFNGCKGITEVTIPLTAKPVKANVFKDCTALTSVTIERGVSSISAGMFSGCTSLESITIPGSVSKIGYGAFSGCESLKNVHFEQNVWYITSNTDYTGGNKIELTSSDLSNATAITSKYAEYYWYLQ